MSAEIFAFPSIDIFGLKFTVDFLLNLRWFDNRLQFKNLHDEYTLNTLNDTNKFFIWTPRLSLSNGLGSNMAEIEKGTSIFVLKEGQARLDGKYHPKAGE